MINVLSPLNFKFSWNFHFWPPGTLIFGQSKNNEFLTLCWYKINNTLIKLVIKILIHPSKFKKEIINSILILTNTNGFVLQGEDKNPCMIFWIKFLYISLCKFCIEFCITYRLSFFYIKILTCFLFLLVVSNFELWYLWSFCKIA